MNELKEKLNYLKENNITGLSFFLTAGYPDMESFKEILYRLDSEKLADFVEVGFPFSDPLADGPVIQRSSLQALKNGVGAEGIFKEIKKIKKEISLPLVLMSYMNVLMSGKGLKSNLEKAAGAGFSGIIIPDLPEGEYAQYENEIKSSSLGHIFLAAPSTKMERVKKISQKSSPFLYYVSSYGVTGSRGELDPDLDKKLRRIRKTSSVPVYCGFGISSPSEALKLRDSLDGIIIGSAFISRLKKKDFNPALKFAINILKSLGRK
ncbi:MAG: tryptophan synthase subunit alpha [Elusimicrobiota bacterium]